MNSKAGRAAVSIAASAVLAGSMLVGAAPAAASTASAETTSAKHHFSKSCPFWYWYYGHCVPGFYFKR